MKDFFPNLVIEPYCTKIMENQTSARPTFLTVVCIISFVGLGLSIVNNLSSMALSAAGSSFYSLIQEGFEKGLQEAQFNDPASAVFLENIFNALLKFFDVLPLLAGLVLFCSIIALVGVIFMWNLKKMGFYMYAGAKVVIIFLPIALVGYNLISVFVSIGSFIGAALFITLYGLNLKAMR